MGGEGTSTDSYFAWHGVNGTGLELPDVDFDRAYVESLNKACATSIELNMLHLNNGIG
jgi:hypothetical protein